LTSTRSHARIAAWQALSDLFLDTDLDERDIASIARTLRATGIQNDELERIYEQEVAPVCWRNARAIPGGVWSGFEGNELAASIARHLDERKPWDNWSIVKRWQIKRWTALTRKDWQRVRRLLG
jgi:hypothetical protein